GRMLAYLGRRACVVVKSGRVRVMRIEHRVVVEEDRLPPHLEPYGQAEGTMTRPAGRRVSRETLGVTEVLGAALRAIDDGVSQAGHHRPPFAFADPTVLRIANAVRESPDEQVLQELWVYGP